MSFDEPGTFVLRQVIFVHDTNFLSQVVYSFILRKCNVKVLVTKLQYSTALKRLNFILETLEYKFISLQIFEGNPKFGTTENLKKYCKNNKTLTAESSEEWLHIHFVTSDRPVVGNFRLEWAVKGSFEAGVKE